MKEKRERPLPMLTEQACCADAPTAETAEPTQLATRAERLKALADVTRLGMLDLLARQSEPLCVCEITAQFRLHQPTISHHLRLLRAAGFADCEKRGVWAYYWATDDGKRALAFAHTLV